MFSQTTLFIVTDVPAPPWISPPRPARPPRPVLERDAVVEAAIRVLDRDGAEGLTMRRVAEELGVTAGSLYGHVANKEELIQLVLDELFAEVPPLVDDGSPWQEQMKRFAMAVRDLGRRHAGWGVLSMGRVPVGPRFLEHMERGLTVLRKAGLPDWLAAFVGDLFGLYLGAFVYEETMVATQGTMADPETMGAWFASLPPDRFPTITSMAGAMVMGDSDQRFEWGLDILLRGVASYVNDDR